MSGRWIWAVAVVAAGAALVAAPATVVLAAGRLAVFAIMAVGAWVTLGRLGLVDLATAAAAGAGAYGGGVLAAVSGWPAAAGLLTGAAAGAAVAGVAGAVGARVGRTLGALTSLSIGLAVVAVLGAWPGSGGVGGFHAVPLLTPHDRLDLAVLLVLLVAVMGVAWRFGGTVHASAAAVAARAPHAAAALGRHPVAVAAAGGAVGGALLGVGGAALAAATGSVVPEAFGLTLAAALAVAVLVGGATPPAAVAGSLFVWGPAVAFPSVPVLGDAPPLLTMGVAGIALLAVRPRGLLPMRRARAVDAAAAAPPEPAWPGCALDVDRAGLPGGGSLSLGVAPGEVVALVGPNGSGKSTLLARIGGQLPDGGCVQLGGAPAPGGALARSRRGVARTWQRPPAVDTGDLVLAAVRGADGAAAARWATALLGPFATAPAGAQVVALAARRPALALLDEPAASLPPDAVVALVRGLAAGGCAVLVVEHRAEVAVGADRVVRIGAGA